MRILVINGSPKGERSNTMRVTNAFLRGMKTKTEIDVEVVNCISKNVRPCRGCFACWTSSPGKCVIKDDMQEIFNSYISADLVIWSLPNYHFGMPSTAKAVLDRLLPTYTPTIKVRDDGGAGHPGRFDLGKQRYILISTCGFFSYENNTEALEKQFKIMYGDKVTSIICLEGELFNVKSLSFRTKDYLKSARAAGAAYATTGCIPEDIQERLRDVHYEPGTFMNLANNSWIVKDEELSDYENLCQQAVQLINMMAYAYVPKHFDADSAVLELYFYDLDQTYQVVYEKDKGTPIIEKADFKEYDVRLEVKYSNWKQIIEDGAKTLHMQSSRAEKTDYSSFIMWIARMRKSGKRKVLYF